MRLEEELKIVSTNEVQEFVSILKDLPADVALEVLAQYPEFTKMISNAIEQNNQLLQKVIDCNQQNADQCFMFYQEILRDISLCLENEQLTYEQRMSLIEKEIEIAQLIGKKEVEIREMNQMIIGGM